MQLVSIEFATTQSIKWSKDEWYIVHELFHALDFYKRNQGRIARTGDFRQPFAVIVGLVLGHYINYVGGVC